MRHFPVLQLSTLGFLRTGIPHAVLYILSEGEVKEGGGKGAEFSKVQGWIKPLNAKHCCINQLIFTVERSTVPDLTSASHPLTYAEKRWGRSALQYISVLMPDYYKQWKTSFFLPMLPTPQKHSGLFSPSPTRTLARIPHTNRTFLEWSQNATGPNSLSAIWHAERR